MKKMHALCIEIAVEAGEVSDAMAVTPAEEENGVVTGGAAGPVGPNDEGSDPDLVAD